MSRPKSKNTQYFTQETEDAILLYNQLEDPFERNELYMKSIKYPFEKLAENIIHTFKFYHFDIPYEDVKHEVVAFLNEKIHKYTDPTKGKAFSYFSIVAKNYLIINDTFNYNQFKNTSTLEEVDDMRDIMAEVSRDKEKSEKKEFMDLFVEYLDKNLPKYFKRHTDLIVADSILELFRTRENIEEYNKKALYILIRERTGVKTQYITRVVNLFKKIYDRLYYNYVHSGRTEIVDTNLNLDFFEEI